VPELPEVETTRRGVAPHVQGMRVDKCIVRERRLRVPVPERLDALLSGQVVRSVTRRGKYLMFAIGDGHLLIHLGMSGSLRLVEAGSEPGKHDHLDWHLSSGLVLRFRDPRRFGIVTWVEGDPLAHSLLASLGPEPLEDSFTDDHLWLRAKGRKMPIKSFVMDSRVVVGVGNIYANEALFAAGIHPLRAAGRVSRVRYARLTDAIRVVLSQAIAQGGTTLRDFVGGTGQPGYFSQSLAVYGRGGLPCLRCGTLLKEIRLGQRTTVYCPHCQR